ncbi:BtpA/SgcQ family protein [Halosegnis marinus]|uniref:BtpA/SgcQ family protein n=1 Tax=Halosegnis marinus TaxID=3034023 RepID=A0ABD5ZP14_9EURY|nr:BtpA/SgcQ family protein [Halosegnis sp. DT85]
MDTSEVFGAARPVVGMVHLPALPGAPRYDREGGRDRLHAAARRDAERLAEGGVDAVMVENFGDAPFYPDDVPKHVVAELTTLARTVKEASGLPVGVNVLRNDGGAAVGAAAAAGADFVRVNVHVGARVTDQGIVEGKAHETARLRERIDADVRLLADVDVKHSAPLASESFEAESLAESAERGLADGVVVSGARTGRATPLDTVEDAVERRDALELDTPVFVGSGVTADTVGDLLRVADGVVVGTALKEGGGTTNPVSVGRVEELVAAADRVR